MLNHVLRRLAIRALRWYGRQADHRYKFALFQALVPPGRPYTPHPQFVGYYDRDLLLHLDTRSYLEWFVFFWGAYEPHNLRLLKSVVQPGMVVADVGANIGLFTLPLARQCGPAGEIHSFEPNSRVFERLRQNVALNRLGQVRLIAQACGAQVGEVDLFVPRAGEANQGVASLQPGALTTERITCAVTTLDAYFAQASRLDLIKLDIEGAELLALQGATACLRRFRPLLLIEAEPRNAQRFGTKLAAMHALLREHGYTLWSVQPSGLHRLATVDETSAGSWYAVPDAV